MESRIHRKIDNYQHKFKQEIHKWFENNDCSIILNDCLDVDKTEEFLQFVYDFEVLKLEKEDFQRRKRVKNQVPIDNRCCAKRANGEQCTRRWIGDFENGKFCGTHSKGQPHGVISQSEMPKEPSVENIEINEKNINGIIYFVDKNNHIYSPEDIYSNKTPRVIAELTFDVNNNPVVVNY